MLTLRLEKGAINQGMQVVSKTINSKKMYIP